MSHSKHFNSAGEETPSVSQIPDIFAHDLSGFESWICSKTHPGTKQGCCVEARNGFYKESANLGHDIHNLREAYLKGESFSEGIPEYQAKVFEPIAKFYKESSYKSLFIEEKMTGATFGGTLDGAGTFSVPFWEDQRITFWDKTTREFMKDKPWLKPEVTDVFIEDLKIKSKLDVLHPLQLYGYMLLLKEVHHVEAPWGLIIRREKKLDKRPEIQLRGYYLPAYAAEWEAAFHMWKFLNQ